MISQEEIKSFLEGNDPEEHIVSVEFDYVSDHIFKIKEVPGKGKIIQQDSLIAFACELAKMLSPKFCHFIDARYRRGR